MAIVFQVFVWLFFWPVILLLRFVLWLEAIGVPYEVLGILYAVCAMGFARLLLRLDRRDSDENLPDGTSRSWWIVTAALSAAVIALIVMCGAFSYDRDMSSLCGAFALMLPVLVGCLWFLIAFLGEFEKRKPMRTITIVCCLTAVLVPVLLGVGTHFGGMAELAQMRENAVEYVGVVSDRAMSERGAYIGSDSMTARAHASMKCTALRFPTVSPLAIG
ncbi:MAG: hypothetical protein IJ037_12795 [Clostridia bacterium]|nr:hypothetical protein [Clostridia bacterium]